jgi:putative DNA-invertase from lambdoid prophage Rac
MTVFGYTRVSTAEQAADDRTSLMTQRRKIAAAAELAGLAIDEIIEEAGVSGSRPLAERPIGGTLLARLRKGDTLIVAKLDRVFRNAADALATAEQLKAEKIDLVVADMGSEQAHAVPSGDRHPGAVGSPVIRWLWRQRLNTGSCQNEMASFP